jgi:hypothetical protein
MNVAHLMVQDLESGVDLDKAACKAIRGGVDSVDLGAQGGSVDAGQGVYAPGSLFFASPIITTQLVFAIDTTTIVAAITDTSNTFETTSLVGSILNQYGVA